MLPDTHAAVVCELERRQAVRRKAEERDLASSGKEKDKEKGNKGGDDDGYDRDAAGKWRQQHMELAEKRVPTATMSWDLISQVYQCESSRFKLHACCVLFVFLFLI